MNKKWLIVPALALGGCNAAGEESIETEPKCTIAEDTTYLIVTRDKFRKDLERFVDFKSDTENVEIVTVDDLLKCNKSNDPVTVVEVIRGALREFVALAPDLQNVLLAGRANPLFVYADDHTTTYPAVYSTTLRSDFEIPALYAPSPTRESVYMDGSEPKHNLVETDQIYADPITGFWTVNAADLNAGLDKLATSESFKKYVEETAVEIQKYDFDYHLKVGRVPARTVEDLNNWMDNTISRRDTGNPVHSMFKDAPCFRDPEARVPGLTDKKMAEGTHKINFHLCQNEDGGNIADLSTADGADLISFFGHGTHSQMGEKYVLTDDDSGVFGVRGFDNPPIIYAHACYSTTSNVEDLSVGGRAVTAKNGAAAFAGYSNSQYDIRFPFYESVFFDGAETLGQAVYETKKELCESNNPDIKLKENMLALNLLGDPSVKFFTPGLALSAPKIVQLDEESNSFMFDGSVVSYVGDPITTFFLDRNYLENGLTGIAIELESYESGKLFSAEVSPFFLSLYANDDLYGERTTGKSTYTFLGGVKCDTENYSCSGSKTEVYPPVAFKCGNFRSTENDRFAIDLEFLNDNDDDREFVFYAYRGLKIPKSQGSFSPEKIELFSASAGEIMAGSSKTIEFDLPTGFNDLPPTEEEAADYFYYPPRYFVAYRKPGQTGNVASTCPLPTEMDNDPTMQ